MTTPVSSPALRLDGVSKSFRRDTGESVLALDTISFSVGRGELAALAGPDGAGKTTLIRLLAGLMKADSGIVTVLGIDAAKDPQAIQSRISYMPQRFGLYDDLTVRENLDLYADLHGVAIDEKKRQYARLMEMTGLDEPTVGVDPLSRRELWEIIGKLVKEGMTVLISTSFLAEAEACKRVLVLNGGKKLAEGPPAEIARLALGHTFLAQPPEGVKARDYQTRLLDEPDVVNAVPESGQVRVVGSGSRGQTEAGIFAGVAARPTPARFEDGFMVLLQNSGRAKAADAEARQPKDAAISGARGDSVVEVRNLDRSFGKFVAVDHVSFNVKRGEIFGLLGPNGAGKTTTFRMLCGLLPPSGGTLTVAGVDVRRASASARQHLGYVAQKFSLYGQLTVSENLLFFGRAYGLGGEKLRERMAWAVSQFNLEPFVHLPSAQLPGGFQQRLAMAAALLHRPEILFLDEPTSGADPFARREFWRRITALASGGVTVIVTTHFMEEAEYCDRAAILDNGKVLAQGTPAELRGRARLEAGRTATMEDAFIAIVLEARGQAAGQSGDQLS